MNAGVEDIVKAVLYEGYNLYPYRPSVKNQHRWTFGSLYPRTYCETHDGGETFLMQTQCLLHGDAKTTLGATAGFLQLRSRRIGRYTSPDADAGLDFVETMHAGHKLYQTWQEAEERHVVVDPVLVADATQLICRRFAFPAEERTEPINDTDGTPVGAVLRQQSALEGRVELHVEQLQDELFKVTLRIINDSPLENAAQATRNEALLRSFASTHALLHAEHGEFVSLTDPPEPWREAAAQCRNVGVWPVLAGNPGQKESMLASPIILYDYPQIAPESPGALFDNTEIDELLTLRILTLTDAEKETAAATDERTRELLERTETLARQQLAGLHGAVRSLQPISGDGALENWAPFEERPKLREVVLDGVTLHAGDHVRLRPAPGADIMDLVLKERIATIESIEQDYEDNIHVAVTLDDDPGRDFGRQRQVGHRFFFRPDELEPLEGKLRKGTTPKYGMSS